MQKAVFPIQSHADITKAISFMHTNYTQAIEIGKPLRVVIDQKHPMYQQVADGLNELISTTDASVEQFTEYLNDIHAFCNKQGCWLSTPDDLMYAWEMNQ